MTDPAVGFSISGRSNDYSQHGADYWSLPVDHLALGRRATKSRRALRGRAELAADALVALRILAKSPAARESFQTGVNHLTYFWKFLDEIEDAVAAQGRSFTSPTTVFEIPGTIWTLFKDWLSVQASNQAHYTYFYCKRVFETAAMELQREVYHELGFPLPPNPFPNPQKAAARASFKNEDTLDPATIKAAATILFKHVQETHDRIIGSPTRIQMEEDTSTRSRTALRAIETHVRYNDIIVPFALVMMRHGWNTSTTQAMHREKWARPHPTRPKQIAELISPKPRAKGRRQTAYSRIHAQDHSYQIVQRVIEWTQPLRDALELEADELRRCIRSENHNEQNTLILETRLRTIMNLVNRIWLYHDTEGKICCLGRSTQYRYINEIFEAHEIHHKGKPLKFSQTLCRDTWAIFTYESSGYHVLVTQVALGHQDLTSILHYFDQKSVRNKHRRQFFGFQTHIMTEITQGRINPRILRVLVEKGEITDAEAETLSRGGFRTRQGVLCMNPKSPDAGIDPGHKPGDTCRSQACLDGCSKAYATLDCLEYVACRIIELRLLRDQMPLPAWTSSDYPHDLQFLETLFEMFSEANREAAIKAAECKNTPMIYTLPSKAALVRTK